MTEFDFLVDQPTNDAIMPPDEFVGPNLNGLTKMSPKKFAQTILDVFERLGGFSWLYTEAKADPKAFMELLKKVIPKAIDLGDIEGLNVRVIDMFGNEVEVAVGNKNSSLPNSVAAAASGMAHPDGSGQPKTRQIATGGNLLPEPSPHESADNDGEGQEDFILMDTF